MTEASNLRSAMTRYYEQFSESQSSTVTYSEPYVDSFGAGMLRPFDD